MTSFDASVGAAPLWGTAAPRDGQDARPEITPLVQRLVAHVERQPQGRMTFRDYMDWVLYQPGGYYADRPGIGPQSRSAGDFVTSPHLCRDFGELLAVQLLEMWERLGRPQPFQVVEMGAGHGLLAVDVVRQLADLAPDCLGGLDYIIVERSPLLRQSQQQQVGQQLPHQVDRVRWCDWDQLPESSVTGCFLSNELVDAFPIHWLEIQAGQLQERYVTWDGDRFQVTLGELSTTALQDYFQTFAGALSSYPDGYHTEVNLAAQDWLATVAGKLRRGYCLTIDYGYPAARYYQPSRREGTLQCYFQHRFHSDPLIQVGQQDITAHVNFTALEVWGEAVGLETLGFTQQGLFLMALGLGDRLAALASEATDLPAIQQAIQRREQLHQLMNPLGLGNFGVLLQAKGLSEPERAQSLRGLTVPAWEA